MKNNKSELDGIYRELIKLQNDIGREKTRVNRIVQVLLKNLPEESLNKTINFHGRDCHNNYISWNDYFDGKTLKDFLNQVIDP